jgi:hypothetical protein
MLTKHERCAAVLLGCICGMGIVAAVIAAGWVGKHCPVTFWLAVCSGCVGALSFFAMQWARDFKAWRRELWICQYCGKLHPLEEHIAHRCER